jgi:hypothetical protein
MPHIEVHPVESARIWAWRARSRKYSRSKASSAVSPTVAPGRRARRETQSARRRAWPN